jgi:DNA-binding MarR family transcriptional regulator
MPNKAKAREELLEQLLRRIEDQTTITVLFHHEIAIKLGLNDTDHKCLDLLIRSPRPLTPSDLANETGFTTGAITGIVDRLEQAGFINRERDNEDRRRVTLVPVEERVQEVMQMFKPMSESAASLLSLFSNEQLEFILDIINKFIALGEEEIQKLRDSDT